MKLKSGDINEDGKEVEQDGDVTWDGFDNRSLAESDSDVVQLMGKEVKR